jgi:hypothetical protein
MLTEGATQAVANALPRKCLCCRGRSFTVADDVFSLNVQPRKPGETMLTAPVVLARCNGCGHIYLFSPEPLGLGMAKQRSEVDGSA